MKWFRKIVDEREEIEIRRIESSAYYVLVFSLGIAIIVQAFVFGSAEHVVGELIVLLVGTGWAFFWSFRKGVWDYRTKPGIKVYIICSLITALAYVIISTLFRYFRSDTDLLTCLRYAALNSIVWFSVVFLSMTFHGTITKQRRKKLEQKFEDAE